MLKCNTSGRRCHCMKVVLENPPKGRFGIRIVDGTIFYSFKLAESGGYLEYVMPYCPWCGARLRPAPRRRDEE